MCLIECSKKDIKLETKNVETFVNKIEILNLASYIQFSKFVLYLPKFFSKIYNVFIIKESTVLVTSTKRARNGVFSKSKSSFHFGQDDINCSKIFYKESCIISSTTANSFVFTLLLSYPKIFFRMLYINSQVVLQK